MLTVAIVLSYGRPELGELLTAWLLQTRPTPLLVWLDGYHGHVPAPPGVHVHRAERMGGNASIGAVRAAAVAFARELYGLGPLDAFLVLDDDDYYSPHHAARTIDALEQSPHGWTGAARCAYQLERDCIPQLVPASSYGPGLHACWGLRLDTYDRAGGYSGADVVEDVRLAERIGLRNCRTHLYLTHVRRQFGQGLSAVPSNAPYDRDGLRAMTLIRPFILPCWRPELDVLESWTVKHETIGHDGL